MVGLGFDASVTALAVLQSGDDTFDLLVILLVGFFGGLYLIYDGFTTWQLARLIQDTPTAKVRSMAVGRTELEGVVREHDGTIDVPHTDEPCVYISWDAERRERHTDEDGDVHYTWETVADGTEALWFDLEDDTGRVLVRADLDRPEFDIRDAGHSTTDTFYQGERPPSEVTDFIREFRQRTKESRRSEKTTERSEGGGLFDRAIDFATDMLDANDPLSNTSKRRRYSQTILPLGTEIYLYGSAEPREGGRMATSEADLLEIRRDSGTGEFLVADVSEDKLQNSYSKWGPIKTVGGLVLSAVALYFLLSMFLFPV
ncbi:GIDE domain-containing protein [Salinibaculum salinum]|uniref:GIDE domain-containing protein n=1 Tax=Salinibaculum salinum TaxID=3131996 RepID=UPI0030ECBA0A